MQTESQPQKSSGGILERMALPLFLLLAAMHLPLVLQLVQRRAEAFWSLTLLIPIVLVWLIRISAGTKAGLTARSLGMIVVDLLLLCIAAVVHSPWLAAFALVLLMAAYFDQYSSDGGNRRGVRVAVLPLLAVGLPPSVAQRLWPSFTDWVANTSSWFASIWGLMHAREAESIFTLTGSASFSQVCAGPIGLLALLISGVVLGIRRRRSVVHLLLCIPFTTAVAAMHAVATVVCLLLFADGGGFWTAVLPCSLLVLLPALLVVDSMDSLVGLFTAPIVGFDMVDADGPQAKEEREGNWVRDLWNRCVSGVEHPFRQPLRFRQSNGELISVTGLLHLTVSDWWSSRDRSDLKLGSLGLVFLCFVASLQYLNGAGRDAQIERLESQLNALESRGDTAGTELAFRGLRYLQPENAVRTLRQVEFLLQQDRAEDATQIIRELCTLGDHGVAEAHLWLVRRSMSGELVSPLTLRERKEHLEAANATLAKSPEIQLLLADVYYELKEFAFAHKYIIRFGELAPEELLKRFAFEMKINRFDRTSSEFTSFVAGLERQQRENPGDVDLTMRLFDAFILAARWNDGILLLQNNDAMRESPELKARYGGALLLSINAMLYRGAYDGARVQSLLHDVISTAPETPGLFETVMEAFRGGCRFRADALADLARGVQVSAGNDEDAAAGIVREAILQLMTAISGGSAVQIPETLPLHPLAGEYLLLLKKTGDSVAASALAEQQLTALKQDNKLSLEMQIRYEVLLLTVTGRSADAMRVLEDRGRGVLTAYDRRSISDYVEKLAFDSTMTDSSADPRMKRRLPRFSSEAEAAAIISGLRRSAGDVRARVSIADRLVRIVIAGGPGVAGAEKMLIDLQVNEAVPGEIAAHIGAVALDFDRFDLAEPWLNRARLLSRRPGYVILNNLAILGVRGPNADQSSREDALKLIDEALQMQPDHPELLATRGEILLALDRPRSAIVALQRSFELDTLNLDTLTLLADTQDQVGQDSSEVREIIRRISLERR